MNERSIFKKNFFFKTLIFSLLIQSNLLAKEIKLSSLTEMKEVQKEVEIPEEILSVYEEKKEEVLSFISGEYRKITNNRNSYNSISTTPKPPMIPPVEPPITPEPPIPTNFVVIWENGQEILNTKEYFLETDLITDGNNHGLRAIEEGTVATNNATITLSPTKSISKNILQEDAIQNPEYKNHTFGGIAHLNSKVINGNTGIINLTNNSQGGLYAGENSFVENNGIIQGDGDIAIVAGENNSTAINNNIIQGAIQVGMISASNTSTVINKGEISIDGLTAIKAAGDDVSITNDGIISGNVIYGIEANGSNSTGINNGIINSVLKDKDSASMMALNGATVINNGIISNDGVSPIIYNSAGMKANGINTTAINEKNARIEGGYYGMSAVNSATIDNKGVIANQFRGMLVDGVNSTGINNGSIENKDNVAIHIINGGLGINNKFINNSRKMNAIYAVGNGSSGINSKTGIIANGKNAMTAASGAEVLNLGTLENTGTNGMYSTGTGSTSINRGNINNKYAGSGASHGMVSLDGGLSINEGKINVLVGTGLRADGVGSKVVNSTGGTISNQSNGALMSIVNSSEGINEGILVNSSSLNLVEVDGNNSIFYNNGTITVLDNQTGIIAQNDAKAVNTGTIDINGDNSTGMKARANGQVLNKGTINLKGNNGTGIYATGAGSTVENKGTINLSNSIVNGNNQEVDIKGNNSIVLENGATFINSGILSAEGNLNIDSITGGKFEVSTGGTIEADSITGDIYTSGALTMGNYSNEYSTYKMLKTNKIDGNIISNSAMFDAKITEKDSNGFYDVILNRKSFEEITNNKILGNYLEQNYSDNSNSKKLNLYDAYKLLSTNKELNIAIDNTFGTRIYPNIQKQTYDIIKFTNNKIENNVFDTPATTNMRYIAGYDYSVFDIDSSDSLEGYITKLSGIYLGMDKKVSSTYRMGGLFNLTENHTNFTHTAKREDKTYQGTLFSIYEKDSLKVINTIFTGTNRGDLKRNYSFSTINENLKGKLKNNYFGLNNSIEKKIEFENDYFLKPKVSLNYISLNQKEINESGDYGIKIDSLNSNSLEGKVELEFGKKFNFENGAYLELKPIIAYSYEMLSPYKDIDASISTLSEDNYRIDAYNAKRGNVEFGVKVEFGKSEFKSYIEYLNVQNEAKNMHITSAGLKYSW